MNCHAQASFNDICKCEHRDPDDDQVWRVGVIGTVFSNITGPL